MIRFGSGTRLDHRLLRSVCKKGLHRRAVCEIREDVWVANVFRLDDYLSILYSYTDERERSVFCSNEICKRDGIGKGSCSAVERCDSGKDKVNMYWR